MLREISYLQLIEWMTFAELEPFDETRADLRSASVTAMLLNIHRKKGTRMVSANDMRLRFGDDKEHDPPGVQPQQSAKEQVAIMKMWANLFNLQEEADAKTRLRQVA